MQPPHINKESHRISDFETSIHTGFQLATTAGPLCAEPMSGVCFFIQKMTFQDSIDSNTDTCIQFIIHYLDTKSAMLSGQIISTIRDGCRLAFMKWSSRLMLATYTCDLQAPSEVLGKVYAVIARRKGRILSEEMQDGTPFFRIRSVLPVIESFGFVDDIRKRTSGAASAQVNHSFNRDEFDLHSLCLVDMKY